MLLSQSTWNTGRDLSVRMSRKFYDRLTVTVKQHNKPSVGKNEVFFLSCEISGQYLPTCQKLTLWRNVLYHYSIFCAFIIPVRGMNEMLMRRKIAVWIYIHTWAGHVVCSLIYADRPKYSVCCKLRSRAMSLH